MSTPLPFIIYGFLGVSKVLCVGIICPHHCLGGPWMWGLPSTENFVGTPSPPASLPVPREEAPGEEAGRISWPESHN